MFINMDRWPKVRMLCTDEPDKKLFFRVSPRHTTCAKQCFFEEKKKISFFFAESFLREISRRNSANVRGEISQKFAEKLHEISRRNSAKARWVGKDINFRHVDSKDSDQTV